MGLLDDPPAATGRGFYGPSGPAPRAGSGGGDPLRALETSEGVTLAIGGERYRFRSADSDWRRAGDEELLAGAKAEEVLKKAAALDGLDPALRRHLQHVARLAEDSHKITLLVILRVLPPVPSLPPPELPVVLAPPPAAKPAPKPKKTGFVEVSIKTDAGKPMGGGYKAELPDGSLRTGTIGGDGFLDIKGLDPGSVKFALTDLDGSSWDQE